MPGAAVCMPAGRCSRVQRPPVLLRLCRNGRASAGFIAQEAVDVIPEAVHRGTGYGLWSIEYGRVTPFLVSALQELDAELVALRGRVKDLETKGKA